MATNDIRRRKPRGSKRDKAVHPDRAHGLALLGYIDVEIAAAMGISESTLTTGSADIWNSRPQLSAVASQSTSRSRKRSTRRPRAATSSTKVVKQGGEEKVVQVRRYVEPDTQAIIYFLNNRRGDKWQTRKAMEHAGPKGAPIQHSNQIATSAGVERGAGRADAVGPGVRVGARSTNDRGRRAA